ncbi:hypothetical protein [Grimontia sp. NTOU-MAR1]|uniref:hypothetical protein n=1 Tax=Grimontia sp. NTOU-MAR1 TaxID=3111011 RepID=UPI002DC04CFC|nr:hypothetical protein [Grimontia sp. NTOU-MAR1]WRW00095.1 hypothetical protein VP504_24245 [Grimontia sp. NTOU-MAR1]
MALGIIVAFGYFFADQTVFDEPATVTPTLAPTCTLSSTPCLFNNAKVSMASNTAAPLIPTKVSVEVTGATPNYLMIELQGVEMNMGTYKIKLSSVGDNLYQGELMLPICMEDEMTWRGAIKSSDDSISLPIDVRMAR